MDNFCYFLKFIKEETTKLFNLIKAVQWVSIGKPRTQLVM